MSYTKGPWKFESREGRREIWGKAIENDREFQKFISRFEGSIDDAHLIAAAPDLLEACKAIEWAMSKPDTEPIEVLAINSPIREAILKAISKAEGRS